MIKRLICLAACMLLTMAALPVLAQSCSAWLPYWEADDALDELEALEGRLDTAVAFAAIFDSSDRVLMLPEAEELLRRTQKACAGTDTAVVLSVVNDVELAPGKYDNKSAELLRRLLKDDQSIARHIEQLFRLVDTYGLSGLEIDYENMKKDQALWDRFAVFIAELYRQFSAQGLSLRVVLSWDAPRYIDLPEGPEYSVMCYNLYGYHSADGPKADFAFLRTTAELYAPYASRTRMAFATGGFVWGGERIRALTQQQAQSLLKERGAHVVRDADSGALYGAYADDGALYAVWTADAETLAAWRNAVAGYGFAGTDLFRLGGNDVQDLLENFLK